MTFHAADIQHDITMPAAVLFMTLKADNRDPGG
jgi:hypothetical protein